MRWTSIFLIGLISLSCANSPKDYNSKGTVFADYWQYLLERNPEGALSMGVPGASIEKLTPVTEAYYKLHREKSAEFLTRVEKDLKSTDDAKTRQYLKILKMELKNYLGSIDFKLHLMPFISAWGFHSSFLSSSRVIPLKSKKDMEAYLQRIKNFVEIKNQYKALLKKGMAQGYVPAQEAFKNYHKSFPAIYKQPAAKSPLLKPLEKASF